MRPWCYLPLACHLQKPTTLLASIYIKIKSMFDFVYSKILAKIYYIHVTKKPRKVIIRCKVSLFSANVPATINHLVKPMELKISVCEVYSSSLKHALSHCLFRSLKSNFRMIQKNEAVELRLACNISCLLKTFFSYQ